MATAKKKYRDYIQSDDESNNPLMSLKKSMDLGLKHKVELENGRPAHLDYEQARKVVEVLMACKPMERAILLAEMFQDETTFYNTAKDLEEAYANLQL